VTGNSVLESMKLRGPGRCAISFARSRDRLHVMPTSTGYEIATDPTYHWNGQQRGRTPFSVLRVTLSGTGRLQYERDRRVIEPGETMLVVIPHQHRYWIEAGDRWEFFLAGDDGTGSSAVASCYSRGGRSRISSAVRDRRTPRGYQSRPTRRQSYAPMRGLHSRLRSYDEALRRCARRRRGPRRRAGKFAA
jgi:hypothetical protein